MKILDHRLRGDDDNVLSPTFYEIDLFDLFLIYCDFDNDFEFDRYDFDFDANPISISIDAISISKKSKHHD